MSFEPFFDPLGRKDSSLQKVSLFKGKRVLVTGGTGMIGRFLVGHLLDLGAKVKVTSMDDAKSNEQYEFVKGDLRDFNFCRSVVEGCNFVFHVAGIKGSVGIGRSRAASVFVPHLQFNTNMMEAARLGRVERYLYTSTIGVYPPKPIFQEDDAWTAPPQFVDRYAGWAKRMGELQAEAYREEYEWCPIAIVRPANVYGPGDNFNPQTAMVVPALIARAFSGENPLTVWGDGSVVRDFIYGADAARGMVLAMLHAADGTPMNLGSGQKNTIKDVVTFVAKNFPKPPQVAWDTSKPTGEPIRVLDVTRAKERLGFTCLYSLEEGIRQTVEWFLAHESESKGRYSVFTEKA